MYLEPYGKYGTGKIGGHPDASSMHVYYLLCYGKAKARTSGLCGPGLIHSVEFIENKGQILLRDDITEVDDLYLNRIIGRFCADPDYDPLSLGPVFDRIAYQILKD